LQRQTVHESVTCGSTPQSPLSTPRPRSTRAEARLRARLGQGDLPAAARSVVDTYGPEVFGFLVGVLGDADAAGFLYANVCQRVTTELEGLDRNLAFRTWVYRLARRELKDRRLRRKRPVAPLREGGATDTQPLRHAGLTDAIDAVRRSLSEEDRELLILRVDRRFDWYELALTELGEDVSALLLARASKNLQLRLEELLERIEREARRHVQTR
jgi:DNA-directed RNA polymerase specialized sigma24 family protein